MDEAFLALIEKKDFSYITVKEICQTAGVNRSTFYLHYETVGDLLSESMEYINKRFLAYMQKDSVQFITKLHDCPIDELYLITPEYLMPYLNYVKENRRLFRTMVEQASALRLNDSYTALNRHVFTPILERFRVPPENRKYMMAFYIDGIMAIINEWLKGDCSDTVEHLISVMQTCVGHRR